MLNPILRLVVALHMGADRVQFRLAASDRGQSTVEYALVLAGVAALVAVVFTQTDIFKKLWDTAVAAIKIPGGN